MSIKISLLAAISADGKIAERADQLSTDWTSKDDTRFFVEKTKAAGVVIMGRKTFETIGKQLKGRLLVVMTRDAADKQMQEGVLEYTSKSPAEIVKTLASRGYTEAILAGGASVYSEFLRAGLVNELYLTVEPVLFGGGVPLAEGFGRMNLELMDMSRLGEGGVLLYYRVIK